MPEYRKVFPSYDWDQDVVYVNQIMNYPYVVGASEAGFIKNVPNEEIKKKRQGYCPVDSQQHARLFLLHSFRWRENIPKQMVSL